MKYRLTFLFCSIVALAMGQKNENNTPKNYQANWESLQNYTAPEWYEDAKLGFWVHWGVYSIPAFAGDHASEW